MIKMNQNPAVVVFFQSWFVSFFKLVLRTQPILFKSFKNVSYFGEYMEDAEKSIGSKCGCVCCGEWFTRFFNYMFNIENFGKTQGCLFCKIFEFNLFYGIISLDSLIPL